MALVCAYLPSRNSALLVPVVLLLVYESVVSQHLPTNCLVARTTKYKESDSTVSVSIVSKCDAAVELPSSYYCYIAGELTAKASFYYLDTVGVVLSTAKSGCYTSFHCPGKSEPLLASTKEPAHGCLVYDSLQTITLFPASTLSFNVRYYSPLRRPGSRERDVGYLKLVVGSLVLIIPFDE